MKNEINKLEFTIYTVVIFFIYLLALLSFYKSSFFNFNKFSCCIGVGLSIVFYVNSQQIINQNQFKQFFILSSLLILFSAVLAILTNGNLLGFILTIYPLLYIIYFRVLIFLFYKDFPKYYKRPTILFASKSKWTTENNECGDVLSKNEIMFSNLLFFGSFAFAAVIAFILI
ncbi:hypothetical protein SAMN05444395_107184 [Flavobacterium fryxellicola]|jgi:hypothetical protein|uniref:Uncharacterized protein n=1 Tax=Flavobacterium fryxellicola TaxID=249352 RepID=A0A167YUQ8_9FLAO|nr:hypothetical protein [Flavobacterium fryxellicola]OAB29811.1 hypothetical protein FBFR_03575 [Flavobacterium fryxellicola]SHN73198.1 hypothetical protein SAMN05444395_107184 [Flavobacterium fryxellicola]